MSALTREPGPMSTIVPSYETQSFGARIRDGAPRVYDAVTGPSTQRAGLTVLVGWLF